MTADHDDQAGAATYGTSRRAVLVGGGAAGTLGVLAACGVGGIGGSGPTVIKVADIPVGGGKVYPRQEAVVTQPTAGTFKAFSAVCTHMGCLVNKVSDGKIICPCHGSEFTIGTGHIINPVVPGQKDLPSMTVTVNGDTITVS